MNKDKHPKFRQNIFRGLAKAMVLRMFPIWYYNRLESRMQSSKPYADESEFKGNSKYCLGIIKEFAHYHQNYIAACRQMNVSYKVIDIFGFDWIKRVQNCGCDAFLVWPSASTLTLKELYDERLKVMVDDLNKIIFPSYDELWMWESKRRMGDWLVANGYSTPQTWIFYRYGEAMEFIRNAELPIVCKTNHGDCSAGVEIIRNRKIAQKMIKKVFSRGISVNTALSCERQCGNILFQEYLPNAVEWRVIKVSDSYFGYKKKKLGDYASGSHAAVYADVPRILLDLIRQMSERHNFMSLSIDVMLEEQTHPYVIEVQSVFGCTHDPRKLRVNGKAGRYIYDAQKDSYVFEEGIFDENICCNLRVKSLLDQLESRDKNGLK